MLAPDIQDVVVTVPTNGHMRKGPTKRAAAKAPHRDPNRGGDPADPKAGRATTLVEAPTAIEVPHAKDEPKPTAVPPSLLTQQLEAVLFVAARPVTIAELTQALGADRKAVEAALTTLANAAVERGIRLQRDGNQVQLVSAPEAALAIERFLGLEATARLSKAALETLSIVAYRQPVTRPEVDALRGVNSETTMRTLLARELVEVSGERATVGHPVEYRTTFQFLEYFGLGSLDDLPKLEGLAADDLDFADPAASEDEERATATAEASAAQGTLSLLDPATQKGHRAA